MEHDINRRKIADVSIPVMIDDVKREAPGFPMTRTHFFLIELVDQRDGEILNTTNIGLPILIVSLTGVIYRPNDGVDEFDSPDRIEQFYEAFESSGQFEIETSELWLPNSIIDSAYDTPTFGDVLRISSELFRLAYSFSQNNVALGEYLERAEAMRRSLRFSQSETEAFRQWYQLQVIDARENYVEQRRADNVLPWRDSSGNIQPG